MKSTPVAYATVTVLAMALAVIVAYVLNRIGY
jgi:hypothetical protein